MDKPRLRSDGMLYIDCTGNEKIEISKHPNWSSGGKKGYSFGVSWGRYGYIGNLLPKEEAIKLANHILSTVNTLPSLSDNPLPSEGEYMK